MTTDTDDTLRDVFAAAAMAGLLAKAGPTLGTGACELLAKSAYRVADAMLEARSVQKPSTPPAFMGGGQ